MSRADLDLPSNCPPRRGPPSCRPRVLSTDRPRAKAEGRPSSRADRSLRHAAPEGHCDRETSAFFTSSERLALTSQASQPCSVGGVRVGVFKSHLSRAANRSALSVSAMRFARGLMCRELREVMNTKLEGPAQQKNHRSITFFIHRISPQLVHRLSPEFALSLGFFAVLLRFGGPSWRGIFALICRIDCRLRTNKFDLNC